MFDYGALEALAAVLSSGSFEGAAARLHVTPSAVSQRIKALEERMGTVLVIRGTPCRGTEAGTRLARHAEQVALMETEVALPESAARAAPVLRIAVNADSLASWVLPALARVERRMFDLVIDDQDHAEDWLRRGEVVGAITSQPVPVPGCDAVPLGVMRYHALAAPEFVARHFPDGPTPEALAAAPALIFNEKDRLQAVWVKMVTGQTVALPHHRIGSAQGFVDAVKLGMGWGMVPDLLAARPVRNGRMVMLAEVPLNVAIYWQSLRRLRGPIEALTQSLRERAAEALLPIS